jgi:phage repressor protein C with HTH and peptisase S24 domain
VFNLDYLLTGKGELLLEDQLNQPAIYEIVQEHQGPPYYNVDFVGGFDLMENDQTVNPDYYINCRPYNDCDCWCNVHGNSMYPTIASGDIIAMKRIHDFSYLINGEIYAIVTNNGLRTIKRVRDNGDTLTLIPDNKEVDEQTIPKSIITHVYLIKGSLKQF